MMEEMDIQDEPTKPRPPQQRPKANSREKTPPPPAKRSSSVPSTPTTTAKAPTTPTTTAKAPTTQAATGGESRRGRWQFHLTRSRSTDRPRLAKDDGSEKKATWIELQEEGLPANGMEAQSRDMATPTQHRRMLELELEVEVWRWLVWHSSGKVERTMTSSQLENRVKEMAADLDMEDDHVHSCLPLMMLRFKEFPSLKHHQIARTPLPPPPLRPPPTPVLDQSESRSAESSRPSSPGPLMDLTYFTAPSEYVCDRFTIRLLRLGDGHALDEAITSSYNHLKSFMPWASPTPDVPKREMYVRTCIAAQLTNRDYAMLVVSSDGATVLGGSGFHMHIHGLTLDQRIAEVGLWIREDQAGSGLGTEVLRAMVAWGFGPDWPWERLQYKCLLQNTASRRVAEKVGFVYEGINRRAVRDVNGAWADCLNYSLLRHEWKPSKAMF